MLRGRMLAAAVFLGGLQVQSPAFATETNTYSYDELGRLIRLTTSGTVNNGQVVTTSFDPAGNRTNYCVGSSCAPPTSPATISIGNASATEGGTLSFTVTRSGATTTAVSASYATANGSAVTPGDYTAKSGTVSFAANQTSQAITVTTINDSTSESTETMTVTLSSPSSGATIGTATGTGTINDNDPSTIAITDSNLNVLPAHQSTYTCYVINVPEYGIYQEICSVNSTGYTVYEWYGYGARSFDPGYSMASPTRLDVQSSYYGTGVSP